MQRAFKEEKILENVEERSKELFGMLRGLQADATVGDTIAEVRGLGLMVGIEFKSPTDPYTPAKGKVPAKMASRVQNKCLEKDLLTLTTSIYETIRCVLPLPDSARLDLTVLFAASFRLSTFRRRIWPRLARSSRRASRRSSARARGFYEVVPRLLSASGVL